MRRFFFDFPPITLLIVSCPFFANADELIEKNFIYSNEDLYLVERSIKQTDTHGVVWAAYYFSMYEPRDSVEIFDGDANVIGREHIGSFQSIGYVGAFDCNSRLEAELAAVYYSGRTPHGSKVLKEENFFPIYQDDFMFPLSEALLNRVCEVAGF